MGQTRFDAEKVEAFLAAYAVTGQIQAAADASGCHRTSFYNWLDVVPDFADRAAEAKKMAAERMIEEARRRAVEGENELVLYKGDPVFVWVDAEGRVVPEDTEGATRAPVYKNRKSDVLLIFLIKQADPSFKERFEIDQKTEIKLADVPQDKSIFDVLRAIGGIGEGEAGLA